LDQEAQQESDVQEKTIKDFDEAALEIKFEIKNLEEKEATAESKLEENETPLESIEAETEEMNPFDKSIDHTFSAQNEKRKAHLKAYNHKFMHQLQRIDNMEKQPAYKRQGMEIDPEVSEKPSRTSVNSDSNDDLHLRSNNSFLHDNVD
jgi:cell division protein FtsZ